MDTTSPPFSIAEIFSNTGRQLTEEYGDMTARGLLIRSAGHLLYFPQAFSLLADLGSLENRLIRSKSVSRNHWMLLLIYGHSKPGLIHLWN